MFGALACCPKRRATSASSASSLELSRSRTLASSFHRTPSITSLSRGFLDRRASQKAWRGLRDVFMSRPDVADHANEACEMKACSDQPLPHPIKKVNDNETPKSNQAPNHTTTRFQELLPIFLLSSSVQLTNKNTRSISWGDILLLLASPLFLCL